MHFSRFHGWCCSAGLSSLLAASAVAQSSPSGSTIVLDNPAAPGKMVGHPLSPVDFFRELLAMKPEEREQALSQCPPAQRKTLSAKLREYMILPPEIRELRLYYTQLRWHLLDLMKMNPSERSDRLAQVPASDRLLVEQRLQLWDGWSADVKKQFLENEGAMTLLLQGANASVTNSATLPQGNQKELEHWQSLTDPQRQEMCERFRQFFDLKEEEKKKTLQTLSQAQRRQMQESLQGLQGLSAEQRKQRLEAFQKFSAMNPAAQRRFLQNAAQWQAMSPKDREAWRKAADRLPPLPPLPPSLATKLPPMPPGLPPLPPMPPLPSAK